MPEQSRARATFWPPGQVGTHPEDGGAIARTNGRSMLIDPWGTVVACASDTTDIVFGELDRSRMETVRTEVPSLLNRRPDAYASVSGAKR